MRLRCARGPIEEQTTGLWRAVPGAIELIRVDEGGPDRFGPPVTARRPLDLSRPPSMSRGECMGLRVRLVATSSGLRVEDAGGRQGVYVPIAGRERLHSGDELLVGRTALRYFTAAPQFGGRRPSPHALARRSGVHGLVRVQNIYRGRSTVVALDHWITTVGRERGDLLIVDDPVVSRQHAKLTAVGRSLYVEDLDSLEGTYRRARDGEQLPIGQPFRIGRVLVCGRRL